jgi:enediyne biosynthesis protein E4
MAPLNGMVVDDFNGDGNLDVALNGNDFGNEVFDGRYDAMNGLLLLGDGNGGFISQTILQSGVFIPGDGKALIELKGPGQDYLLAASQNRGPLKLFRRNNPSQKIIPLQETDRTVFITLTNKKTRREELYYGNSFLSQSSRFLSIDKNVSSVEVQDSKGKTRLINLQ